MRWTAEADRQLLFCLIQTLDGRVDYQGILDVWPETFEQPTLRAIKERFLKLKSMAVKEATGEGSPASSPAKAASPRGKAASPRKRNPVVKKEQSKLEMKTEPECSESASDAQ